MGREKKLTTAQAKRAVTGASPGLPHGVKPGAVTARLLRRLGRASPALLELLIQRALTDPMMKDSERTALTRYLLDYTRRLEDDHRRLLDSRGLRAAMEASGAEAKPLPATQEDVQQMEAHADRLQRQRMVSYQERMAEWRAKRDKAANG